MKRLNDLRTSKKSQGRRGIDPRTVAEFLNDGTLPDAGAVESSLQKGIPKQIVYTVLCGLMTPNAARKLAGYSQGTPLPTLFNTATPNEIRERLQSVAGVTLADQVQFYADMRDAPTNLTADRIKAAQQIDKTLGYEAPARLEINERKQNILAIHVFQDAAKRLGMRPHELAEQAERIAKDAEIAEFEEASSAPTEQEPPDSADDLL